MLELELEMRCSEQRFSQPQPHTGTIAQQVLKEFPAISYSHFPASESEITTDSLCTQRPEEIILQL